MIKLVIFDLDGTLVDTIEGIRNSGNILLKEYGKNGFDRKYYESIIGRGAKGLIESMILDSDMDVKYADEMLAKFIGLYTADCLTGNTEYEGMHEIVKKLADKGVRLAINTNKPQIMAEQIISDFYDSGTFFAVKGACSDYPHKPSPAGAKLILDELNINSNDCVYVGDSVVDIKTASNANLTSIGVTWGYGKSIGVENADYVADDAETVLELISKL